MLQFYLRLKDDVCFYTPQYSNEVYFFPVYKAIIIA